MEPLEFSEALKRVLDQAAGLPGAWPTTPFRLLVKQREGKKDRWVEAVVANFQASPAEAKRSIDLVEEEPTVLHGVMAETQFADALDSWSRGEPFEVDGWAVWPPDISTKLYWNEFMTEEELKYPLIAPLPPHASGYLVQWLSGGGNTPLDNEIGEQVFRAARAQRKDPRTWVLDYLGVPWSPYHRFTQLEVRMPIPIAVDASYESSTTLVTVDAHYHGPFSSGDFWVRLGRSWSAAIPTESFQQEVKEPGGWKVAHFGKTLRLDEDTSAWVGKRAGPSSLRWQVPIPVTLGNAVAISPDQFREWCLQFMNRVYELAGPSTTHAQDVSRVADELKIPYLQALQVMQYLVNKGLLRELGGGQGRIELTTEGIGQVVEAKSDLEQSTIVNVTMRDVTQSQIQIASPSSQQYGEFVTSNEKADLTAWVQQVSERLKDTELAGDNLEEVKAELATITAQLRSPKPRRALLSASVQRIVAVLGAAASVATVAPATRDAIDFLVTHAPHLLGG